MTDKETLKTIKSPLKKTICILAMKHWKWLKKRLEQTITDKQKTIDGVDVSGCEHLYREIDCLAYMDFSECCEGYNPSYGYCPNIDCYYKQLKRKEQELEKLKKQLIKCDDIRNIFKSELDFVKDYNGEIICLQVRISKLKELEEIFNRIDQLKAENEELKKIIEKLDVPKHEVIDMDIALENEKLKQTLTEIKEIAKLYEDGEDKTIVVTNYFENMMKILQKISECEVE